jgi:hypothetical protein
MAASARCQPGPAGPGSESTRPLTETFKIQILSGQTMLLQNTKRQIRSRLHRTSKKSKKKLSTIIEGGMSFDPDTSGNDANALDSFELSATTKSGSTMIQVSASNNSQEGGNSTQHLIIFSINHHAPHRFHQPRHTALLVLNPI